MFKPLFYLHGGCALLLWLSYPWDKTETFVYLNFLWDLNAGFQEQWQAHHQLGYTWSYCVEWRCSLARQLLICCVVRIMIHELHSAFIIPLEQQSPLYCVDIWCLPLLQLLDLNGMIAQPGVLHGGVMRLVAPSAATSLSVPDTTCPLHHSTIHGTCIV